MLPINITQELHLGGQQYTVHNLYQCNIAR